MKREWSLDGQWTLYYGDAICHETFDEEKLECVPAQVPGNVELDLSRAGVLPEDLFKGMNPCKAEKYESYDWWYCKEFDAPQRDLDEKVFLYFEGVDCLAEYELNGQIIGTSNNAFIPHEFEVTNLLQEKNVLRVHIRSALLEQLKMPYAQYLLSA
ncbi:MAG: hypothetical protein IJ315_03915 [Firmicutes bacterium]|nr:hypothetical protein [Bacillota bacterium]